MSFLNPPLEPLCLLNFFIDDALRIGDFRPEFRQINHNARDPENENSLFNGWARITISGLLCETEEKDHRTGEAEANQNSPLIRFAFSWPASLE